MCQLLLKDTVLTMLFRDACHMHKKNKNTIIGAGIKYLQHKKFDNFQNYNTPLLQSCDFLPNAVHG